MAEYLYGLPIEYGTFDLVFDRNLITRAASDDNVMAYTIVANDNFDYRTASRFAGNYRGSNASAPNPYVESGFSNMQLAIDKFLLGLQYGPETIPTRILLSDKVAMRDEKVSYPYQFFGLLIVLFYTSSFLAGSLLETLIEEKANGVRDLLRNSTVFHQYNLITLFILHMLMGYCFFAICIAIHYVLGVTSNLTAVCTIILVVLYVPSAIMFMYLLSIPFENTFYTMMAIPVIVYGTWALQFLPLKFMSPLISSIQMTNALGFFDHYDAKRLQFGFADIFQPNEKANNYSMAAIWLIIVLDTLLYALLYTYLVQVFPGKFGTPEPILFPIMRLRNCCQSPKPDGVYRPAAETKEGVGACETVIRIRGLIKEYGMVVPFGKKPQRVLNGINLDICARQINVLLGHNGAGKTTLMSIVSGALSQTAGEIRMNDESDVKRFRHLIGYCPQHNTFLPFLTVLDNFIFIGRVSEFTEWRSLVMDYCSLCD